MAWSEDGSDPVRPDIQSWWVTPPAAVPRHRRGWWGSGSSQLPWLLSFGFTGYGVYLGTDSATLPFDLP